MLQFLHKIIALILAFTVLFSSFSFTVEKHICMGEITDVSYFTAADSCGMTDEDCDINDSLETKIQKEKCCNDVHELIPGNQNEQQALQSFEIEQVQFIIAYTNIYINLFEDKKDIIPYKDYKPPLVDKDINVLYQTFLI